MERNKSNKTDKRQILTTSHRSHMSKVLACILSLALVISMLPSGVIPGWDVPAKGEEDAVNVVSVSSWSELKDNLTSESKVDKIILTADITPGENENYIVIPGNITVILDLNGHTIDRQLSELKIKGYVIIVKGKLTLEDSVGGGKITGGNCMTQNDDFGGGVYIFNSGTFTMNGGTITGNVADYGGGVYNKGAFNMNGGTISNNKAYKNGGGVCNFGTFTMTAGTITGNSIGENSSVDNPDDIFFGGGVYNNGRFNMSGGYITDNSALNGGGVFLNLSSSSVFNVSGNPVIIGNGKEGKNSVPENNVFINCYGEYKAMITVSNDLLGSAKIGVTREAHSESGDVFTNGEKVKSIDIASRFVSDDPSYAVMQNGSEAQLVQKSNTEHIHDAIKFENALTSTNSMPDHLIVGESYYLKEDVTLESDWTVDEDIYLCLNGHKIDLNGHGIIINDH